jgi:hypothetical protein
MTAPFEKRLNRALNELIETRPVEGDMVRMTALATLTELFLEASHRDPDAIPAHFAEIMSALLPRVPLAARAEASRLLAHSEFLPIEIVRLLAADSHEVAGPVLRQSPCLDQNVLLEVARGPCGHKALAIASRNDLSAEIIAALLDRADVAIGATLAEGHISLDSREAGRIALLPELPTSAARRLIDVPGLDDKALAALFWRCKTQERLFIVNRMIRRREALPIAFHAAGNRSDHVLGSDLVKLAARRQAVRIAARLAANLGVPETLARTMVDDPGGEALVIAGRACHLSIDHVTGLVLLTAAEAGTSYDALRRLVDLAELIEPHLARHMIGLWNHGEAWDEPDSRPAVRHEPAIARPGARSHTPARSVPRQLERKIANAGGGE